MNVLAWLFRSYWTAIGIVISEVWNEEDQTHRQQGKAPGTKGRSEPDA